MLRLKIFFKFLGMQNDYLYPFKGAVNVDNHYRYKKAHLWKTRLGFKTAWGIAVSISNGHKKQEDCVEDCVIEDK